MFELDFKLTKIPRICKNHQDFVRVKAILKENFKDIKNIFLAASCESNYPAIALNEYTFWCQKCGFHEQLHVNTSALDTIHIATIVRSEEAKGIDLPKHDISRFEFLEIIVRIAILVYHYEIKEYQAKKNAAGGPQV